MRTLNFLITSTFLVFAINSVAFSQSVNLTETFKKSFNETVQQVQNTEDAVEKRTLLNESFDKMTEVIERIESKVTLSEDKSAQLKTLKNEIQEKKSELNGKDGFERVLDRELNHFSDYSQNYFEQADRTITIGLTAALLIILILLLFGTGA